MRHFPIVFNTIRGAIENVELGDIRIPAGAFIIADTAAANRDPAVYDELDRPESPAKVLRRG